VISSEKSWRVGHFSWQTGFMAGRKISAKRRKSGKLATIGVKGYRGVKPKRGAKIAWRLKTMKPAKCQAWRDSFAKSGGGGRRQPGMAGGRRMKSQYSA
jgi:hypothetical protein